MYQNNNDFVHSIEYTIEKRVASESIRKKLYDLLIIHKNYIHEQLFRDFLEVVRNFRQKYNETRYFTKTFMLFTLAFLVECKSVNLEFYVKKFPDSDEKFFFDINEVTRTFPQCDLSCTRELAASFDLFVFYNNNNSHRSQPQQRANRCSRSRERFCTNSGEQRRYRSRSNDLRSSRSNDSRNSRNSNSSQDEEQKIILCIQQRDALIAQLNKEKDDLIRVIEMRNGFIRERDNIIHNQNAEIIRLRNFINGVQQRPAY
jgi:hypothetical protein